MKGAGKIGVFIAVLVLAGATANPGYTQDAEQGKTVFKACAACHATDHDNRVGPGLEGTHRQEGGCGSRLPLQRRHEEVRHCLGYEDPRCVSGSATEGGSRKQDALRGADLVERWPGGTAQLVLASRNDPPVRLHRLRLAGELCELRDQDLSLSLAETGDLLANFGVGVDRAELALLHERSEGWAAAVQMAALSLRAADDQARVARALDVRSHLISEYFIAEVLDQQPPELARFLLDTSVLGELTAG